MAARTLRRLLSGISRLWREPKPSTALTPPGSIRPIDTAGARPFADRLGRRFDEEIEDRFVRSPEYGAACVSLARNCPEAGTAIDELIRAALFGVEGDAVGFVVTADDTQIEEILARVVRDVLGGMRTEGVLRELCEGGNSFAVPTFEPTNNHIGYRLCAAMPRPPWEMFRLEDNHGYLQGFEQRSYRGQPDPVSFDPVLCVHWRYRPVRLYGRALFHEVLEDWLCLQQYPGLVARAGRSLALNRTVHEMPEGRGGTYRRRYSDAYQNEQRTSEIADLFVDHGVKVYKESSTSPDLTALLDSFELFQRRIIMKSGVPPYMFGLETGKANNLSGAPSRQFVRHVRHLQSCLSEGLRSFLNLELALHGIPRERWDYEIVYPAIAPEDANAL